MNSDTKMMCPVCASELWGCVTDVPGRRYWCPKCNESYIDDEDVLVIDRGQWDKKW